MNQSRMNEIESEQRQELFDFMKNGINNNTNYITSVIQKLDFKGCITTHRLVPLHRDNIVRYTNLENKLRFYRDYEKRIIMFVPGLWSATWLNPSVDYTIVTNISFDKTILYNDIKNELNITYDYDLNTLTLLQHYVSEHYDYLLKKYQND